MYENNVLRYRGPIPLKSNGGDHKPSIWYIRDKKRYESSIQAIDQLGGFVPYEYGFKTNGEPFPSCRYFSLARYDFRSNSTIMLRIGNKNYAFSVSSLREEMTPGLNRIIEDFHMLCCDLITDFSNADKRATQTLIFPTNRGFFTNKNERFMIVGCYYSVKCDPTDGSYSIFINDELAGGPYAADDDSGFDWLKGSIARNIGEWRRNNGIY